jgi:Fibronectin type III domain
MLKKGLPCVAACVAAIALSGCRDPGPVTPPTMATPSASGSMGSATLSWEAPTANTNGSPLTDLAGYRIYYGSSPKHLSHTVHIKTVGLQTYVIDDLEPGTWYFAVKSVAANGVESSLSDVVAKTIT